MKKITLLLLISISAFSSSFSQIQQSAHLQKKVTVKEEIDIQYLLFTPSNKEHAKDGKLPLIIFLHGAGERGSNIEKVKVHGPPKLVEKNKDFGFYVLSPLCKKNTRWSPKILSKLLDDLLAKNKNIDTSRIYLTGLSMGGYGTYDWAIHEPNRFAALAPICGGSETHSRLTDAFKHIPIWIFHGAMDSVVDVNSSIKIAKSLKEKEANVQFTIYPFATHDSWTETYKNEKLYKWFLTNKLNI